MANYEQSYWKAVQFQEQVEKGEIQLYKKDVDRVLRMLKRIQEVAFLPIRGPAE